MEVSARWHNTNHDLYVIDFVRVLTDNKELYPARFGNIHLFPLQQWLTAVLLTGFPDFVFSFRSEFPLNPGRIGSVTRWSSSRRDWLEAMILKNASASAPVRDSQVLFMFCFMARKHILDLFVPCLVFWPVGILFPQRVGVAGVLLLGDKEHRCSSIRPLCASLIILKNSSCSAEGASWRGFKERTIMSRTGHKQYGQQRLPFKIMQWTKWKNTFLQHHDSSSHCKNYELCIGQHNISPADAGQL